MSKELIQVRLQDVFDEPEQNKITPYYDWNLIQHNEVLMQQVEQYEQKQGGIFYQNKRAHNLTTAQGVEKVNGVGRKFIQFPQDHVSYTDLAHELGHALGKHQAGKPSDYTSPDRYAHARAIGEAEAMLNEYRVSKAMGQSIARIHAENPRYKYFPPQLGITGDKIIEFNGEKDTWYNHIDKMVGNNPVPEDFFSDPKYKKLVDAVVEYRKNLIPSSYGHLDQSLKLTYREEDILSYLDQKHNFLSKYQSVMRDTATPLVGDNIHDYPTLMENNPELKKMLSTMIKQHLYTDEQTAETLNAAKQQAGVLMAGGQGDNSKLIGSPYDDVLIGGGKGHNVIQAGAGNDILHSGNSGQAGNRLEGGEGYDTYHTFGGDIVRDSDGMGKIYFDTTLISGTVTQIGNSPVYRKGSEQSPEFFCEKMGENLIIYNHPYLKDSHFMTIEHFQNGQFNIQLKDNLTVQHMPEKGQRLYDLSLQKLQPWLDENKFNYSPENLEQLSAALAATLHEQKMNKIDMMGLDDEKKTLIVASREPHIKMAKIDLYQAAEMPVHHSIERMQSNEQLFAQAAQARQLEREQTYTRSMV